MEIIPQLLLIAILVFLNGFFVASEFSLVAVRKTRIDELVKKGSTPAKLVQKAIANLDTVISATQLGITLASLALGWIGEPTLARFLEPVFDNFLPGGIAMISAHGISITIAFLFITFLHIVLGELAPKTIALQKSELVSLVIIAPLTIFTNIFKPFIWVLNESGNLVLRFAGFHTGTQPQRVHSEEEIKMILAQSAEEGAIEEDEAEMVYSVLRFGDIPVQSIMIPRIKVVAFEKDTPLLKVIKVIQKNPHSRFPVYEGSMDKIIGFVHVKDIYRAVVSENALISVIDFYKHLFKKGDGKSLFELKIIRQIPHVLETKRIDDVLLAMQKKRVHIAVVDDENGGTEGIVTLEDVVEKLTGEIHDEFEEIEEDIKK